MTKVLVLDDDPDMRALLERELAGAGYSVALAESAAAAKERIAGEQPDLIIADINMPEVNGVEFVAGLKGTALGRIPVIYLTALEANTELAVRTLGFPLLSKPVRRGELLALVARQVKPSAKDVAAAVDVQRPAGN